MNMRAVIICSAALLLAACGAMETQTAMQTEINQAPISMADTCEGKPPRSQCWMELQSHSGCYVWNAFLLNGMTATWDGSCSGQRAEGTGTLTYNWEGKAQVGMGELVDGKSHGPWVLHHADGRVEDVVYEHGKMAGGS